MNSKPLIKQQLAGVSIFTRVAVITLIIHGKLTFLRVIDVSVRTMIIMTPALALINFLQVLIKAISFNTLKGVIQSVMNMLFVRYE